MTAKLGEKVVGAKQKVSRVPQIAFGDVARGGGGVRLLDEGLDRVHMLDVERHPGLDIAVAGARLRGSDAERHQPAAARRLAAGLAGLLEQLLIENHVIGGQRQHHRVRIAPAREHRAGGYGGTGIAGLRLEHDIGLGAELLGLMTREESKIVGRHHDRRIEQGGIFHPLESLLIGRKIAGKRQELFRHAVARDRPESRAGSAGEKHGGNLRAGHRDDLCAERLRSN